MAIFGFQQINVGLPNESANSDSLYAAFNKVNNNFTNLFNLSSQYTTFTAGNGMTVSSNANSGTVTFTNTGVLSLTAGVGVSLSGSNGNVIISANGSNGNGGITSVGLLSSTINVTGSPLVTNGNLTINLPSTGVLTGTYTYPTVTVDSYGRITNIANANNVGTVTSVGLIAGAGMSVTGGPITSNGNITVTNTGVTRLSAGSGIILSGSNGNVTISAPTTVGTVNSVDVYSNTLTVSGGPITVAGVINVEIPSNGNTTVGNLTVNGNLSVQGNTTYINTEVLIVEDPIIQIGTGPNGAVPTSNSGKDIGTALNYYDTAAKIAWMGWDVSNAEISFGSNVSISSEVVTINTLANVRTGNLLTTGNANISGTAVITTGNITTINSGLLQNGTSNITLTSNNDITFYVAGNANARVVFTSTGSNITGTLNATGNANVGNLGTATAIITTGNITTINSGLLQNGTSNVTIASGGNVTIAVAGTERVRADTAGNIYLGATTGSESLRVQPTASSVNFVLTQGGAVGTGPTITATGSDANVNLRLATKGSGQVQELVGSTYYALASQYDVGTNPNQIPLNQYLGTMAYQDSAGISVGTAAMGIGTGSEGLRVTPVASSVNYINTQGSITGSNPSFTAAGSDTNVGMLFTAKGTGNIAFTVGNVIVTGAGGLGYGTGSGGTVTQGTSRTTGVTLNKTNGSITLVSAAGTTAWQSFTVTNNTVAATDTIKVNQRSGTDLYMIHVTAVAAGSFNITFATTGGTTTEQPVFNFAVIKAVTA